MVAQYSFTHFKIQWKKVIDIQECGLVENNNAHEQTFLLNKLKNKFSKVSVDGGIASKAKFYWSG